MIVILKEGLVKPKQSPSTFILTGFFQQGLLTFFSTKDLTNLSISFVLRLSKIGAKLIRKKQKKHINYYEFGTPILRAFTKVEMNLDEHIEFQLDAQIHSYNIQVPPIVSTNIISMNPCL